MPTPHYIPSPQYHIPSSVSRQVTLNSSGSEYATSGSSSSSNDSSSSFMPHVPFNTPETSGAMPEIPASSVSYADTTTSGNTLPGVPILQIIDSRSLEQKLYENATRGNYENKRELHVEKERARRY